MNKNLFLTKVWRPTWYKIMWQVRRNVANSVIHNYERLFSNHEDQIEDSIWRQLKREIRNGQEFRNL